MKTLMAGLVVVLFLGAAPLVAGDLAFSVSVGGGHYGSCYSGGYGYYGYSSVPYGYYCPPAPRCDVRPYCYPDYGYYGYNYYWGPPVVRYSTGVRVAPAPRVIHRVPAPRVYVGRAVDEFH